MVYLKYKSPETTRDAVALLSEESGLAKVFAGGTDLLVQMHEGNLEPALLVDIKKIPETRQILFDDKFVRIGAAVTGAEINENKQLVEMWPGVAEAVELIGSYQIQGRATIGGNLCNASPAADSVPALMAAGARLAIAGTGGIKEVKIEELYTGPGKVILERDEFVTAVVLPIPRGRTGDAYLRFIPRTEMDIAVVGAGASLTLDSDERCTQIRLALGAVAPTARLVNEVQDIIVGKKLSEQILKDIATAACKVCQPIDDKRGTIKFRTKVAGVMSGRVVKIAWSRARGL